MHIEALLVRRRVLAASARRHAPRRVPAAAPPHALVTEYTRELVGLSDEMDAAIRAELAHAGVLAAPRADAVRDLELPVFGSTAARVARAIVIRLAAITSRRHLVGRLEALARRVGEHSRAEWAKQLRAAFGVDLLGEPDLGLFIAGFRRANLELITSLAADKVARVRAALQDHGVGAGRVETLAARIARETGATASRAALIARDQVLTLNARITQARHQAAGVHEYTWSTSRDERVRPAHRALDGERIAYAHPPVVDDRTGRRAHAGQDFQCRCVAVPILPGLAA